MVHFYHAECLESWGLFTLSLFQEIGSPNAGRVQSWLASLEAKAVDETK